MEDAEDRCVCCDMVGVMLYPGVCMECHDFGMDAWIEGRLFVDTDGTNAAFDVVLISIPDEETEEYLTTGTCKTLREREK